MEIIHGRNALSYFLWFFWCTNDVLCTVSYGCRNMLFFEGRKEVVGKRMEEWDPYVGKPLLPLLILAKCQYLFCWLTALCRVDKEDICWDFVYFIFPWYFYKCRWVISNNKYLKWTAPWGNIFLSESIDTSHFNALAFYLFEWVVDLLTYLAVTFILNNFIVAIRNHKDWIFKKWLTWHMQEFTQNVIALLE